MKRFFCLSYYYCRFLNLLYRSLSSEAGQTKHKVFHKKGRAEIDSASVIEK
jgi:hypothetical protein